MALRSSIVVSRQEAAMKPGLHLLMRAWAGLGRQHSACEASVTCRLRSLMSLLIIPASHLSAHRLRAGRSVSGSMLRWGQDLRVRSRRSRQHYSRGLHIMTMPTARSSRSNRTNCQTMRLCSSSLMDAGSLPRMSLHWLRRQRASLDRCRSQGA